MFELPRQAVLTRRDFVNTWECDENHHWNVQFYARAFEQAAEIGAALTGWTYDRRNVVRHVRYHREMHSAQSMSIHSLRVANGSFAGSIVHLLTEAATGGLAATALDTRLDGTDQAPLPEAPESAIVQALPRGVPAGVEEPANTGSLLRTGRAVAGHLGVVRSHETDREDRLLAAAVVSRFTDSAAHIWSHVGIGEEWLTRSGHGRVAVEMKLVMLAGAREGDALRLVSWIDDMQEKTFAIRHQLEHIGSGEIAAQGSVRALVMNLSTRKAAPLPREMRESFAAMQG